MSYLQQEKCHHPRLKEGNKFVKTNFTIQKKNFYISNRLKNNQIREDMTKNTERNNHKLTEYFPVRRSVRKTKKTVLEEKQKFLEEALRSEKEDGLVVSFQAVNFVRNKYSI